MRNLRRPIDVPGRLLALSLLAALGLDGVADPLTVPLVVPALATLPSGPWGESINRGRDDLAQTAQRLPAFVGNGLTCKNCHLGNGTEVGVLANAAPLVGVAARYPQYSARHGAMQTLAQRINDCFERSLNGKPLPFDHPAMVDMLAYMSWLSQGIPMGATVAGQGIPRLTLTRTADTTQGQAIYTARCLPCHGADGGGTKGADGGFLFPPLWGPLSFNAAAGMARHDTAAGFIKHKMPLGAGDSLSDDAAWDVSAYLLSNARPDAPGQAPHVIPAVE
jgi:thiosulfate dehydrogenase